MDKCPAIIALKKGSISANSDSLGGKIICAQELSLDGGQTCQLSQFSEIIPAFLRHCPSE